MKRIHLALSISLFLYACGGGNSNKQAAIVVSLSPATQMSIDQGQAVNFTATVSNDKSSAGVNWSMSGTGCSGSACGTFANMTAGGVTYNAPSSVSSNMTVSITATSVTDATKSMTSSVVVSPAPAIATTSLASGMAGSAYSATLHASGGAGTLTWSVTTGNLPAGLSLSASGAISGTPTTPGTSAFTVKVADSSSTPLSATQDLSLTIDPAELAITTSSLSNGVVGTAYNATLESSGGTGTVTWSVTTGSLPAGLTLSVSGAISGTPTGAGTSNFTVTAKDSGTPQQVVNQALSLAINSALVVTTTSLPNGVVSSPYSATLQSTGGVGTITWTVTSGSLPAGLVISSAGAISGTPTAAGSASFTATAKDSGTPQQSVDKALSISVYTGLTITTTTLPDGAVNSAYSATLASAGGTGTVTWTVDSGNLPAGLQLSNSGTISGTPTASGTSNFTVKAADSGTPQQTKTQALSLTINPGLTITTTSLPGGTVGASYSQTISTQGGTTPITWSVTAGSLPTGLQLQGQGSSGSSATISGTPSATGTFPFTVTATDSSHPAVSAHQSLSISISNTGLAILTTSLPGGAVSASYNATLAASGGTPPYTWSLASGSSLPAGLTLSTSGTISGAPTGPGTFNFTVKVTDSTTPTHQTLTKALSIDVSASACGTGNESILNGQYAFTLGGYNATGYLAEVGSFTADGSGHITAGEVDSNGTLGVQHANITTASSSYSVGSDNRGCATLVTSFGTFTTRFALGSIQSSKATEGRMIEWETGSSAYIASGHILKQTTPFSSPSGNFVFVQAGAGNSGDRIAAAGVITLGSGSITTGEMDMNDFGTLSHSTGVTGTYTSPDSNGRATMTTTWSGSSLTGHAAFYLVSASQGVFMPTDSGSAFVGEMKQQSGTFSNSSVSGNMVVYMSGLNGGSTGGSASLALVHGDGHGALTGSNYYDGAGTWQTPNPGTLNCNYSVAANGRMTITNCGSGSPVFYLTAAGTGFSVTSDSDVATGQVEPQVGSNFTAASVSGNFYMGPLDVASHDAEAGVGVAILNGAGGVTVTNDYTATSYQQGDEVGADTVTVHSDGTFSTSDHPGVIMGLIISSSKFVIIDNINNSYPNIQVIKQ